MYGLNNNTGTPFQNHMNVLKNNSIRNRINSAKEKKQDKSLGDTFDKIMSAINVPEYLKQIQEGKTGMQRLGGIFSIGSLFKGGSE